MIDQRLVGALLVELGSERINERAGVVAGGVRWLELDRRARQSAAAAGERRAHEGKQRRVLARQRNVVVDHVIEHRAQPLRHLFDRPPNGRGAAARSPKQAPGRLRRGRLGDRDPGHHASAVFVLDEQDRGLRGMRVGAPEQEADQLGVTVAELEAVRLLGAQGADLIDEGRRHARRREPAELDLGRVGQRRAAHPGERGEQTSRELVTAARHRPRQQAADLGRGVVRVKRHRQRAGEQLDVLGTGRRIDVVQTGSGEVHQQFVQPVELIARKGRGSHAGDGMCATGGIAVRSRSVRTNRRSTARRAARRAKLH